MIVEPTTKWVVGLLFWRYIRGLCRKMSVNMGENGFVVFRHKYVEKVRNFVKK